MILTNTIRTIALASIVAAGSLALFAQTASAREASAPSVSEIVVTKATDVDAGDLLIDRWQRSGVADDDVDGRDFLTWQRGSSPAEHEVGHWMGIGPRQ